MTAIRHQSFLSVAIGISKLNVSCHIQLLEKNEEKARFDLQS